MNLKNKNILITGGAGFVGSHLTEKLVSEGANVIVIDDFSNGTEENLKNVIDNIKLIEFDITSSFSKLREILEEYTFDGIFNLACFPRSLSLKNPFRDTEVNALGMINILELARINKTKVVFTSNSGPVSIFL